MFAISLFTMAGRECGAGYLRLACCLTSLCGEEEGFIFSMQVLRMKILYDTDYGPNVPSKPSFATSGVAGF